MNDKTYQPAPGPRGYEVCVRGQIDPRWLDRFDQWMLKPLPNGNMMLSTPSVDQAGLHGLIMCIRDLNLVLISINPL
jgi:hypothetical protein